MGIGLCSDLTYEELKPFRTLNHPMLVLLRSDLTYEELKPSSVNKWEDIFSRSDLTYEELKPKSTDVNYGSVYECSDLTYEELKRHNESFQNEILSTFRSYL